MRQAEQQLVKLRARRVELGPSLATYKGSYERYRAVPEPAGEEAP